MELPLGTQAGRKATHDFLSLYSSSTAHTQQDPTPSQGGYLKTHDFLQPLERVGNNVATATTTKDDAKVVMSGIERPPIGALPPPGSAEHLLPGGIGTYSITYFNQRALKPEGTLFTAQPSSSTVRNDENSNCSSYTGGGGFTLWDESAAKKGKTGKENVSAERHILREAGVNVAGGPWTSLLEKPSQSSSNHNHNTTNFSSFSSSQPSSSHKNQSFMDMITSARNDQEEDDDEEEEEYIIKKEPSSHSRGNSIKVEAKTLDQKPNTPRSKHSATEQRRRSKINDRFQKLREIIPNSEQKRDKASFLLEVIEYIQFLQEKVNRYEGSYSVWNHEPSKMTHWRNSQIAEGFIDQTRGAKSDSAPTSLFVAKVDDNKACVSGQNLVDSDLSTATTLKERAQHPDLTYKAAAVHPPMQPSIFRTSVAASPVSPKQTSDVDNKTMTWPPPSQLRSCTADSTKTKDHELTIESGTINISSAYSQGLLNTLTQALQSSGVDLSQANISVQIDIGKRANGIPHAATFVSKEDDNRATASAGEEFGHALKKLRTS